MTDNEADRRHDQGDQDYEQHLRLRRNCFAIDLNEPDKFKRDSLVRWVRERGFKPDLDIGSISFFSLKFVVMGDQVYISSITTAHAELVENLKVEEEINERTVCAGFFTLYLKSQSDKDIMMTVEGYSSSLQIAGVLSIEDSSKFLTDPANIARFEALGMEVILSN